MSARGYCLTFHSGDELALALPHACYLRLSICQVSASVAAIQAQLELPNNAEALRACNAAVDMNRDDAECRVLKVRTLSVPLHLCKSQGQSSSIAAACVKLSIVHVPGAGFAKGQSV
jgi:hypothetical protein